MFDGKYYRRRDEYSRLCSLRRYRGVSSRLKHLTLLHARGTLAAMRTYTYTRESFYEIPRTRRFLERLIDLHCSTCWKLSMKEARISSIVDCDGVDRL